MTAIDTETSERFTYSYSHGVLSKLPVGTPSLSTPHTSEQPRTEKRSVRTLLHDFVIERIEQSVKHHPFFWLCVSSLLR